MKRVALSVVMALAGAAAFATSPEQAHDALLAACPGLRTHAADVTLEKPRRQVASVTDQRERKWTEVYAISARVADKPSPRVLSELRAQGQRCEFEVEASKGKDVAIGKATCMAICLDERMPQGAMGYVSTSGTRALIK